MVNDKDLSVRPQASDFEPEGQGRHNPVAPDPDVKGHLGNDDVTPETDQQPEVEGHFARFSGKPDSDQRPDTPGRRVPPITKPDG